MNSSRYKPNPVTIEVNNEFERGARSSAKVYPPHRHSYPAINSPLPGSGEGRMRAPTSETGYDLNPLAGLRSECTDSCTLAKCIDFSIVATQ